MSPGMVGWLNWNSRATWLCSKSVLGPLPIVRLIARRLHSQFTACSRNHTIGFIHAASRRTAETKGINYLLTHQPGQGFGARVRKKKKKNKKLSNSHFVKAFIHIITFTCVLVWWIGCSWNSSRLFPNWSRRRRQGEKLKVLSLRST